MSRHSSTSSNTTQGDDDGALKTSRKGSMKAGHQHFQDDKDRIQRGLAKLESHFKRNANLSHQPYYHGKLPREEIEQDRLLEREGDFLIRESDTHDIPMILTVFWEGRLVHVPITFSDKLVWSLGHKSFKTVPELLIHHVRSQKPVGSMTKAKIFYPISKDEYNLNADDITLEKELGSGAFGIVYLGKLVRREGQINVAIKALKIESADKAKLLQEKKNLLSEARIMKRYRHPNVVRFLGICVMRDPVMIVMEFCPGGALDSYLKKHEDKVRSEQLLSFCIDAANGMRYLHSKSCIHRDLAARNCLLSGENVLKISDFGLSREGSAYQLLGHKPVPIRWSAPEVLARREWTQASDVFAYGILLWEMYSNAHQPYPAFKGKNVELIQQVVAGYRMPPPKRMAPKIIAVMTSCWVANPKDRPDFKDVYKQLRKIYDAEFGKKEHAPVKPGRSRS